MQLGQQFVAQNFVGVNITKPEGFVGGHGIDHLSFQAVAARPVEPCHQITEAGAALLLHDFAQSTLHQILLVLSQQNAAALFQKAAEFAELSRCNIEAAAHPEMLPRQPCSIWRMRFTTTPARSFGLNLARKPSAPTFFTMDTLNPPLREVCSTTCSLDMRWSSRIMEVSV